MFLLLQVWCYVNHRIINWVLTYIEEKKGPRHLLINSKKKNIDVWILKLNTLIILKSHLRIYKAVICQNLNAINQVLILGIKSINREVIKILKNQILLPLFLFSKIEFVNWPISHSMRNFVASHQCIYDPYHNYIEVKI